MAEEEVEESATRTGTNVYSKFSGRLRLIIYLET